MTRGFVGLNSTGRQALAVEYLRPSILHGCGQTFIFRRQLEEHSCRLLVPLKVGG